MDLFQNKANGLFRIAEGISILINGGITWRLSINKNSRYAQIPAASSYTGFPEYVTDYFIRLSVQFQYLHVPEPYLVTMVLQGNMSFCIPAVTGVIRPFTCSYKLFPLLCPELVFNNFFAI